MVLHICAWWATSPAPVVIGTCSQCLPLNLMRCLYTIYMMLLPTSLVLPKSPIQEKRGLTKFSDGYTHSSNSYYTHAGHRGYTAAITSAYKTVQGGIWYQTEATEDIRGNWMPLPRWTVAKPQKSTHLHRKAWWNITWLVARPSDLHPIQKRLVQVCTAPFILQWVTSCIVRIIIHLSALVFGCGRAALVGFAALHKFSFKAAVKPSPGQFPSSQRRNSILFYLSPSIPHTLLIPHHIGYEDSLELCAVSTPFSAQLPMLTQVTPAGLCGLFPRKLCCCWAQVCGHQRRTQHTFSLERTNWEDWNSSLETPSGERWTQFYWPKRGGKKKKKGRKQKEKERRVSGSNQTLCNNIPSPERSPFGMTMRLKEIIWGGWN